MGSFFFISPSCINPIQSRITSFVSSPDIPAKIPSGAGYRDATDRMSICPFPSLPQHGVYLFMGLRENAVWPKQPLPQSQWPVLANLVLKRHHVATLGTALDITPGKQSLPTHPSTDTQAQIQYTNTQTHTQACTSSTEWLSGIGILYMTAALASLGLGSHMTDWTEGSSTGVPLLSWGPSVVSADIPMLFKLHQTHMPCSVRRACISQTLLIYTELLSHAIQSSPAEGSLLLDILYTMLSYCCSHTTHWADRVQLNCILWCTVCIFRNSCVLPPDNTCCLLQK